jgi:hypothetical protein
MSNLIAVFCTGHSLLCPNPNNSPNFKELGGTGVSPVQTQAENAVRLFSGGKM